MDTLELWWMDMEHRTSLDAVEGHHRERINVWMLFGLLIVFGLDACICLDMWMYNLGKL